MMDGEVVGFGHGSGIAISPTRIVTNAHVVESAARYPGNVALGVVPSEGQKSFAGKLIAIDTERDLALRSEEHTSELQSLMRISYAVFCLQKKNEHTPSPTNTTITTTHPNATPQTTRPTHKSQR